MVVTVKRLELIKLIEKNRANHLKEYESAVSARKAKIKADLTAAIKGVDAGKDVAKFRLSWPVPQNHVGDYDRVLLMLKMSVDETIQLHEAAAAKFIEDRWDWSHGFSATNSVYRIS